MPLPLTPYPIVPLGSALKSMERLSVESTPVAVAVTTEAHAPEEIALVPSVEVPLATVMAAGSGVDPDILYSPPATKSPGPPVETAAAYCGCVKNMPRKPVPPLDVPQNRQDA